MTAEERAKRDAEGQQVAIEAQKKKLAELEAQKQQSTTQATPAPTAQTSTPTGQNTAPAGQPTEQTNKPTPDAMKDAAAMYGIKRMADDATNLAFGGGQQSSGQSAQPQPAQPPTPAQPSPEEEIINKRAASRTKTYQRQKEQEIAREEDTITYLQNMDTSKMPPELRARHAVNIQRAQRRLKAAQGKELPTPENIRGEVAREAAKVPAGTAGTIQQGPPAPRPSAAGTPAPAPTTPGARPTGAPAPGIRPAGTPATPGIRPTGAPAPGTRPAPARPTAAAVPTRVGMGGAQAPNPVQFGQGQVPGIGPFAGTSLNMSGMQPHQPTVHNQQSLQ